MTKGTRLRSSEMREEAVTFMTDVAFRKDKMLGIQLIKTRGTNGLVGRQKVIFPLIRDRKQIQ